MSQEKAELEAKYLKEFQRTKEQSSDREKSLTQELEETTSRFKREHQNAVEGLRKEMQEKLKQQEQGLLQTSEEERENLSKVKDKLIGELQTECNGLRNKLKSVEDEVKRLDHLVHESEQGLGSASSHIDSLKQALSQSKEELQRVQNELQVANKKSDTLTVGVVKRLIYFAQN